MKILALDTSSDACSAALLIDDKITEKFIVVPQQHTKYILPMIAELLADAKLELSQLDAIAFGCGPGSFTGIRLAASVAQGLAFGAKISVVPISTLRALAQRSFTQFSIKKALVAIDARMKELYLGGYQLSEDGFMEPVLADILISPEKTANVVLSLNGEDWVKIGRGWEIYGDILRQHCNIPKLINGISVIDPHACDIAVLGGVDYKKGKFVAPAAALPVYLRDDVVHMQK